MWKVEAFVHVSGRDELVQDFNVKTNTVMYEANMAHGHWKLVFLF